MATKKKPKLDELLKQIENAKGNISALARTYGVTRTTVYGWIKGSKQAQQVLADQRETVVDVAESVLYKLVLEKDFKAVAYVLNNSPEAKRRGWSPRQEVTGAEGAPLVVQLEWGDAPT